MTPGTYFRYGDVIIKDSSSSRTAQIVNSFILEESKLKKESDKLIEKVRTARFSEIGVPKFVDEIRIESRL
jgi:hypothetical protein